MILVRMLLREHLLHTQSHRMIVLVSLCLSCTFLETGEGVIPFGRCLWCLYMLVHVMTQLRIISLFARFQIRSYYHLWMVCKTQVHFPTQSPMSISGRCLYMCVQLISSVILPFLVIYNMGIIWKHFLSTFTQCM